MKSFNLSASPLKKKSAKLLGHLQSLFYMLGIIRNNNMNKFNVDTSKHLLGLQKEFLTFLDIFSNLVGF